MLYWGREGAGRGHGSAGRQRRRKNSLAPRSSVRAPGPGWLGNIWYRAARSSAESLLLHSCSSCSRAVTLSQRPGPKGPWIAQPAEGRQEQTRPQGGAPKPASFPLDPCVLGKKHFLWGPKGRREEHRQRPERANTLGRGVLSQRGSPKVLGHLSQPVVRQEGGWLK